MSNNRTLQNGSKNCGSCEKCLRTFLGIVVAGGAPAEFGMPQEVPDTLRKIQDKIENVKLKICDANGEYMWQDIKDSLRSQNLNGSCHLEFFDQIKFEEIENAAAKKIFVKPNPN